MWACSAPCAALGPALKSWRLRAPVIAIRGPEAGYWLDSSRVENYLGAFVKQPALFSFVCSGVLTVRAVRLLIGLYVHFPVRGTKCSMCMLFRVKCAPS